MSNFLSKNFCPDQDQKVRVETAAGVVKSQGCATLTHSDLDTYAGPWPAEDQSWGIGERKLAGHISTGKSDLSK